MYSCSYRGTGLDVSEGSDGRWVEQRKMMQEAVWGGVVSTYGWPLWWYLGERVMQWGIGVGGWAGVVVWVLAVGVGNGSVW